MPKVAPAEPARTRFAEIAAQIAAADGSISAHRKGFGTRSMFVGKKMFAVYDTSGELVVKLPPERVQELIAEGVGHGWHPGGGTPLKEYLAVPFAHEKKWTKLAREARAYMGK